MSDNLSLSIFVMTWARTRDWCCHSVTEEEEKPLQYPTIFNSVDVAVITKMDLARGGRAQVPQ
jgi:Ni2+-binding GTPase involved in maturation of urease and hydrogenase